MPFKFSGDRLIVLVRKVSSKWFGFHANVCKYAAILVVFLEQFYFLTSSYFQKAG